MIHRKKKDFQKITRAYQWVWQNWRIQINMQKSIAFLYNNNELSEKEIKETSHSPSHQKE